MGPALYELGIFITMLFYFLALFLGINFLFSQEVNYQQHFTIASHNSYEKKYASNFEEVLNYVQAIEIDIWDSYSLLRKKYLHENWYVRHSPFRKGNFNNLNGSFKDYLVFLKSWSDQNPNHSVITIFIDKKQNWKEANNPEEFDKLIESIFSKNRLYTPKNLVENEFHSLENLKRKFIFVITDATLFNKEGPLNEYLKQRKDSAIAFVAPSIKKEVDIINPPKISNTYISKIKFYNMHYKYSKLVSKVREYKVLSRVYHCPENYKIIKGLIEKKVNFIAVNNFKIKI